jgi:hypothetical protein
MNTGPFVYAWRDGKVWPIMYGDLLDDEDRNKVVGCHVWEPLHHAAALRGLVTKQAFQRLSPEEMPAEFRVHLLLLGVSS